MGEPNHPIPDTPAPPQRPSEPPDETPLRPHPAPPEPIKLRARRRVALLH